MRREGIIAAGAVLAVAIAVLVVVLLLRGGPPRQPTLRAGTPTPSPSPTKHRPPPRARFELKRLPSVSGSRHPKQRKVRARAKTAALHIEHVIENVYTYAFLDRTRPAWWLLRQFAAVARHQFRIRPRTDTISPFGGQLKDGLHQLHSTLKVRTLFAPNNHPASAIAVVYFQATGRLRTGTRLVVRSRGTFFLKPGKHGWRIYGFEVQRRDRHKHG